MSRRFELVEGASKKFWEVTLAGNEVTTRYGRIGSAGQSTTKVADSAEAARVLHDKLVAEKTKKGYVEVAAAIAPAEASEAARPNVDSAAPETSPDAGPGSAPNAGKKARKSAAEPQGLLSAVKEKNLLAKLRADDVACYEALVKASPGRNDIALFADLIGRKLIGFEHGALLASLLRYARHVQPTLLWDWLCGLPAPRAPLAGSSGGCPLEDFLLEDVPLRLFIGVRAAWKRAPEVFDPCAAGVPSFLRDTLLLVHAQAGRPIPEADRVRLLDRLASQATRPHAVPRSFDRVDSDEPFVRHVPSWLASQLGASRDEFGERVFAAAPEGALSELLVALQWWEPRGDGSFEASFSPMIRRIPPTALTRAILEGRERIVVGPGFDEDGFERGRTTDAGLGNFLVLALLDARDDGAEALYAMADELRAAIASRQSTAARNVRELADLFLLVAHERDRAESRPIDPDWMLRAVGELILTVRVRALLPRVSASARQTLAQHDEEHPEHPFDRRFALVAEALAESPDARAAVEALVRRSRPRHGSEALLAIGRGLVAAMPQALVVLLETRLHSDDVEDLDALRGRTLILLGGLAESARRGVPLPEAADVYVGPGELEAHPRHDWRRDLAGQTRDAYGEILAALPSGRRRTILAAWIGADTTGNLGIREWISGMPALVQADAPNAPAAADIVRRLVAASRRPADTTIYLLERCTEEETAPTLRSTSVLRGLAAARIPARRGKALEHLITFDFDALPALARVSNATEDGPAYEGAAGIAVFLRPGGGWTEDNDDVEVVALSREELSAGHDGGVPFRATAVEVPAEIFISAKRDSEPVLASIWDALRVPAGIALGAARRIQGDTETYGVEKSFLFDADTRLLPINMGDAGVFHAYSFGGFLESC